MVFGFLKRKKPRPPVDPIAAFDGLIEDLERQAAEVRKSAATLLALRGELSRDRERYQHKREDLGGRIERAAHRGDGRAERVLRRDLRETEGALASVEQALATADEDARLLLDAASELATRVLELRTERMSARARLSVGLAVSRALQEKRDQIDKVLAVDAARDEIERAKALADIYREEAKRKG
ncbi:MAG: PspA/IM30 family protein [Myxococcota bacterium]